MSVTSQLKEYLRGSEFRDGLVQQYTRFEILSEGGLRTAAANLIREKLQTLGDAAMDYRVTCEVRLKEIRVVPDILIWKKGHPRIWIELKDTKQFDQKRAERDWQKLQTCRKRFLTVKAGYLIYVARHGDGKIPIKRDRNTRRYWLVEIAVKPRISDFIRWDKEYSQRAHYAPKKVLRQEVS